MASLISPTVARARAASMHSASRLPLPRAPSSSASSAARQACLVPRLAHVLEPRDLLLANLRVVDVEDVDVVGMLGPVLVDPDDDFLAPIDPRLTASRRLLDPQLRHAGLDGLRHAAERLDLLDQAPRLRRADRCVSAST